MESTSLRKNLKKQMPSFVKEGDSKLAKIYELLCLSRMVDEKMAKMVKQNKGGTFQLSSAGHELIGAVAGQCLISGKDWSFPYYRDQPFAISMGCDITELFAVFLGRKVKNHSSGRMMPYHFSDKSLRIYCQSSVVGSQFLQAVGCAFAIKQQKKDEVVYVSAGDGATSQGDFHEAMNFASIHQLGVIFVIQDNGWAISVPASEQTGAKSIATLASSYQNMQVHEVDGTNFEELQFAFESSFEKARKGKGPSVVIAKVARLGAHSNSDDPKKYRTEESMIAEKERDPLEIFANYVKQKGVLASYLEELKKEIFERVERYAQEADRLAFPQKGSSLLHVYAPFDLLEPSEENFDALEEIVIVDAINHALVEEMEFDPTVVVFGQDVAGGKGGVFGATRELTKKFGDRCFNTPLAESTIIGIAIGMSAVGIKAVAEIQFADYVWTGINQLFNEAASICYRSNGEWSVPIVIRMPYGGYIQGGPYHSQSIEGFLTHCPGLKVVVPSNSQDAKMLLKAAIRDPNPVVFLEHKGLYRQQCFCAKKEPSPCSVLPFGKAKVIRKGEDATVVAWGAMVPMAFEVAEQLSEEGFQVEIIDLRTLVPLDTGTIFTSVEKTGKLLIVQEAPQNCGFSAEVAARVAEEGFSFLDAPIMRLSGFDSAVPYSKPLEEEVLPQKKDVELAMRKLLAY